MASAARPPGFVEDESFPMDSDDKENIRSENHPALGGASLPAKSARKAKGYILRKSLAWNKAFIAEEGVLDPMELSMLAGSAIRSRRSFLSGMDKAGMSPLARFDLSSKSRKAANWDTEENKPAEGPSTSNTKFPILEAVIKEDSKSHVKDRISGAAPNVPRSSLTRRTMSNKRNEAGRHNTEEIKITEGPSRSRAKYGMTDRLFQSSRSAVKEDSKAHMKRASNSIAKDQASKISKVMPTKVPSVSPQLNPRGSLSIAKSLKPNKSSVIVKKPLSSRGLSSVSKKFSSGTCTNSTTGSANDMRGASTPHMISEQASPIQLQGLESEGSCSVVPSFQKVSHQNNGSPPAPALAKQSALRMPSPSIGFFSQKNLPSSSSRIPKEVANTNALSYSRIPSISLQQLQKSNSNVAQPSSNGQIAGCSSTLGTHCKPSKDTLRHSKESEMMNGEGCDNPGIPIQQTDSGDMFRVGLFSPKPYGSSEPVFPTADPPSTEEEGAGSAVTILLAGVQDNNLLDSQSAVFQQSCSCVVDSGISADVKCVNLSVVGSTRRSIEATAADADINISSEIDFPSIKEPGMPVSGECSGVSASKPKAGMPVPGDNSGVPAAKGEVRSSKNFSSRSEHFDKAKPDVRPLKEQLSAAPFTDEWVAAVEAYGEAILELKTGPVQNSPPDKSPPEANPWSLVKKKVQELGPYDCTKYFTRSSASEESQ